MDELTRGAVLTLLSVLTGGALVVLGNVIAERRLDDRLKRAVRTEMRLNISATQIVTAAPEINPLPRLRRDAWRAAQGLGWSEEAFLGLAEFYMQIDRYEDYAESVSAGELNLGGPWPDRRQQLAAIGRDILKFYPRAERAIR